MKTLASALQAHYDNGSVSLAVGLVVTRSDAQVFRWTSHDRDVTIGGNVYSAGPGLDATTIVTTAGLAVDNLELRILYDDDVITRADILAGLWDNAEFSIIEFNWRTPTDGTNTLLTGTLGEVQVGRTTGYTVELRSLKQALQQPVGSVLQRTCRYRFASQSMPDGLCMLNPATYTVTGTITSAASNQVFTDTGRTEADDYFGEGILTFTSGENSGYRQRVKTYAADVFTLALPMPFTVQVGDTYSVIAGCRKRFEEDCRDKFSNELNFGGEPHGDGIDKLTAAAETDA